MPTTFPSLDAELAARAALATPQDAARGMFFAGVLRVVRAELGDAAAERCRQASGEKRFIELFNYPVTSFIPLARVACQLLAEKHGGEAAALRHIGRQASTDFFASATGRTLVTLAGRDPRRLMNTVPTAYRTALSYGERRVVWDGPSACRLEVRRDFMPPAYHEGVLTATLEAFDVTQVEVTSTALDLLDADYALRWKSVD